MLALQHKSVMLDEVLEQLAPQENQSFIDLTLGGGGHCVALLEKTIPSGVVFGVDRDLEALEYARNRLKSYGDRLRLIHSELGKALEVLTEAEVASIDGALMDCGVSSFQLDMPERGFSYGKPGPIDMRMNPTVGETAYELICRLDKDELANIIYQFGEERNSRRIANAIKIRQARLHTTQDLREAIESALPGLSPVAKKNAVVRCFQALRIAVNEELKEIERGLNGLLAQLKDRARVAVITFHSLEDRLVKNIFRDAEKNRKGVRLNKKVIVPSRQEYLENRRSRSAKLRVFEIRRNVT